MIVIMLCAGKGSRLKSKTSNLPKCMVKVKKKQLQTGLMILEKNSIKQ